MLLDRTKAIVKLSQEHSQRLMDLKAAKASAHESYTMASQDFKNALCEIVHTYIPDSDILRGFNDYELVDGFLVIRGE